MYRPLIITAFRFAAFTILLTSFTLGAELTLSPHGPLRTPEAARDKARTLPKPVTITVKGGEYPLTKALELGPEDSQVSWRAAEGETPLFTGGKKITGWIKTAEGVWQTNLPEVAQGKWYFEQLWINGRRATRARTPNRGFALMTGAAQAQHFDTLIERPQDWHEALPYKSFVAEREMAQLLARVPLEAQNDVTIVTPRKWIAHRHRLAELRDSV